MRYERLHVNGRQEGDFYALHATSFRGVCRRCRISMLRCGVDVLDLEGLGGLNLVQSFIADPFVPRSLAAAVPSMVLLEEARAWLKGPVWINADVLPGPGGRATPLDAQAFLQAVAKGGQEDVLSLGWTTGWSPDAGNPGYSWEMVQQMEALCRPLGRPVTFPVRAALLSQSFPQFQWLLQQSDRYTLTIWTGQKDSLNVEDLLPYRQHFDKSRIYYDLLDFQLSTFKTLPGYM